MIFRDFKVELNQKEYLKRPQLAYGIKTPSEESAFRWLTKFSRDKSFLPDEEHTLRQLSAISAENVSIIRKMLITDNLCIYQMVQKEHYIYSY
ncbi:hypothetical protein NPIL_703751 [Nephila pilipes]|uniref:Uncharacterized protein n=1 Tax=Nephila pilipes TaxID=299642 RepID=A0A8X6PSK5_NEPPI|nr:hypothetical protein NPIL_703751 [Nephila pilipes]